MLSFSFFFIFIGLGVIDDLLLWFNQNFCVHWLAIAGVDSYVVYVIRPLVLVVVQEPIGFIALNHWLIALAPKVLGKSFPT